ncbi:MAG TPA: hypothetical protein VGR94_05630 [Candidatus Acidoferrales bacterium]|nr:hypothetical protein [Candidatus Acidoferrales bacterium]
MGNRCYSTLVCAERDKDVFEKMGYRADESKVLSADGNEVPSAVVMVDEEANNGHYDELNALTGVPFLLCNGSCPGAFGDHLIVSDGTKRQYSEALHESNYPAVRVEPGGVIRESEVNDARKYWAVYSAAVAAIKSAARRSPSARPHGCHSSATGLTHSP